MVNTDRSRLILTIKTKPINHVSMSGLRRINSEDGNLLGQLMYAAYNGTVDDEGDTQEQTIEEAVATLHGKYGPILWDCSFVIIRDFSAISASIVSKWGKDNEPLLAFSLTIPKYQRQGYGSYLIHESLNALYKNNYSKMRLFVTESNIPAISLYRKIGFSLEVKKVVKSKRVKKGSIIEK